MIFATWYTYPYWMAVTATKIAPNKFSGTLYRTFGPDALSGIFDSAAVGYYEAGSATFSFTDGNNATFLYEGEQLRRSGRRLADQVDHPTGVPAAGNGVSVANSLSSRA